MLTLGVDDLARSLTFYRDGLQVPQELIVRADDHFALHLREDFSLVFFERSAIAAITGNPVDTSCRSEHIIGHAAASKDEVDEILRSAGAAGGTVIGSPKVGLGATWATSSMWTGIYGRTGGTPPRPTHERDEPASFNHQRKFHTEVQRHR